MASVANPRAGLATGDNNIFQKYWHEVSINKIGFGYKSVERTRDGKHKWFPCNSGGTLRKWSATTEIVVNWENNGEKLRSFRNAMGKVASRPQNTQYYFKEGLTWNKISSSNLAVKYKPIGFIYDDTSRSAFVEDSSKLLSLIGLLCSCVALDYLKLFNPTMSFTNGDIARIPINDNIFGSTTITSLVQENISISKQDWDAHETSWDFRRNELLGFDAGSIEERVEQYKQKWEALFMRLHANEEELNRRFIDIYGLQDELTPDVPLNEVTILQQGEITIENGRLVWHDDVIIKQLVSYAVGCMTGRYSIDREGLILANQGDGQAGYEALVPHSRFAIDDDGIIPLMSVNNELTDHITLRFKAWLDVAFGRETLTENLNFVEKALGKRIEDYFLKDFWKDHKRMYQNRPVYWLFSSKKGAFQCLVYMHRMDAYTAEKVRTRYLLPHIEWLVTRQAEMQADAASLSARERRETDALGKQTEECREYHDRLHVVADRQIGFDLDDGVAANYAKLGDVLVKLK